MWNQDRAEQVMAGVQLVLDAGHVTPGCEDAAGKALEAVEAALAGRDLPGLWRAAAAFFAAADLDLRWYLGPVLSDEERTWLGRCARPAPEPETADGFLW